jgi:hypothetical protein
MEEDLIAEPGTQAATVYGWLAERLVGRSQTDQLPTESFEQILPDLGKSSFRKTQSEFQSKV